MKTRAAVAIEAGKPLEIMEVDLDGPRAGEVPAAVIRATVEIVRRARLAVIAGRPHGLRVMHRRAAVGARPPQ